MTVRRMPDIPDTRSGEQVTGAQGRA